MTIVTNAVGRRPCLSGPVASAIERRLSRVALIDRRTGAAPRIGGRQLAIFTVYPAEAATELLKGRDPCNWDVRVETFTTMEPA